MLSITSILIPIIVFLFIYYYLRVKEKYKYFKKNNIRYVEPIPVLGNIAPALFRTKHMVNILKDIGNHFVEEKYFGFYELTRPVLVVQDAGLIKQIGVRQADNFINRANIECIQPDFFTTLPFLSDDTWRKVRPPATMFFSPNRIKEFYPILINHVQFAINHYEKLVLELTSAEGHAVYEEDIGKMAKYFIASTIISFTFNEDINPFENENNVLLQSSLKYADLDFTKTIKAMGWDLLPSLMRICKASVLPKNETFYLMKIFSDALKERIISQTDRPDLCQAHQDIKRKFQKTSIPESGDNSKYNAEMEGLLMNQILIMLVGGLDTTGGIISTMFYELTKCKNVQDKLRAEIDEVIEAHGSNPPWEIINQMKYLEMVSCESLRMWPQTLEVLHRVCNHDTTIEPPREGGTPYTIRKGDKVWLSVVGVHYSEKYWINPTVFDPERFNEENRPKIHSHSYIPFGVGPRTCIAVRFALMLMKSMTFHFFAKFELEKTDKFNEALSYDASNFTLQSDRNWGGISLRK